MLQKGGRRKDEICTMATVKALRAELLLIPNDGIVTQDQAWSSVFTLENSKAGMFLGLIILSFCFVSPDDVRLFGFVRFTTGDAMSKRVKFALITWIGEDVSGLQRAKTGTDKTLVKEVVQVTSSFCF